MVAFLPDWVQTLAHRMPTYYGMHALQMSVMLFLGVFPLRRSVAA
ncbi:MAG TPA: hypothetical protein VKV73_32855 [Chloroflexota bacterium]|nr:hypothetical protein [Chloroflexota bacterium]